MKTLLLKILFGGILCFCLNAYSDYQKSNIFHVGVKSFYYYKARVYDSNIESRDNIKGFGDGGVSLGYARKVKSYRVGTSVGYSQLLGFHILVFTDKSVFQTPQSGLFIGGKVTFGHDFSQSPVRLKKDYTTGKNKTGFSGYGFIPYLAWYYTIPKGFYLNTVGIQLGVAIPVCTGTYRKTDSKGSRQVLSLTSHCGQAVYVSLELERHFL